MLSEACRESWEAERDNIRKFFMAKKFNPKSVDRAPSTPY